MQPSALNHLSRLFYELGQIGARAVGEKKGKGGGVFGRGNNLLI